MIWVGSFSMLIFLYGGLVLKVKKQLHLSNILNHSLIEQKPKLIRSRIIINKYITIMLMDKKHRNLTIFSTP